MPVTVLPVGVSCNLQCGYCYEDPQRDASRLATRYDLDAIKEGVEGSSGGPFLLFGGEPLLMNKADLEDLWAWGFEKFGVNNLQTNGTLIDDDHIALFSRYNVRVSISIDGPGPLNDSRWHGTLERTRASTARTEAAIERLCRLGKPPGILVVLHRLNAGASALRQLVNWFRRLEELGVRSIGLHLLEADSEAARQEYSMSDEDNVNVLLALRALQRELPSVRFSLLADLESLLMGDDSKAKCIWSGCDPYTTKAVEGIGGHGESLGCGRVIKDGVAFQRASETGFERYLALYHTPQAAGGCQGCRFFLMCKGQCPGTALDADWRNRSEMCGTWKGVFTAIESDLVAAGRHPLSLDPARESIEREMVHRWERGERTTIVAAMRSAMARVPAGPAQGCAETRRTDAGRTGDRLLSHTGDG